MDDDPLAAAVGAVMKENGAMEAKLEEYARGELSDAERAELEANAKRDPELQRALELHAPLSADVKARLLELGRDAAGSAPNTNIVELRSRRRLTAALTAISVAAAAAIALFVLYTPSPQLPSYTLSARAGDAQLRGGGDNSGVLRADSEIELTLRPMTAIDPGAGTIEGRLYAGDRRIEVAPEISADGAVRWIGRADVLAPAREGKVTLTMIIGFEATLPHLEEARRARSGKTWQAETVEVVIRPLGGAP